GLWAHAEELGARFERADVVSVSANDTGGAVTLADGRTVETGKLILAAGAWSHRLAQHLGDHIPLDTERGYNTT
ncbi:FAD-binding oxidoreductase, partial [Stenotrophomonas maltophilia]|uniref:FAD-binding oxidoreductase n=1 Tax=Stenotrophomonas maltophilia TaxID=40324 RepID=UPI0013DC927E